VDFMCILGFLKNSRNIIVFALHCGVQEEKCRCAGRNCPTNIVHHTSASLIINENYDYDVSDDTETFLNQIVPEVSFLFISHINIYSNLF